MATIIALNNQERAATGYTHKIVSPYTDWTDKTSGTAYSILPALGTAATPTGSTTNLSGTHVGKCTLNVTTAFVFAPGTLAITIGDGGSANRFLTSTSVKATGSTTTAGAAVPYVYPAADTIDITMTAGAGALSSITAGVMELYFTLADASLTLQTS